MVSNNDCQNAGWLFWIRAENDRPTIKVQLMWPLGTDFCKSQDFDD